MPRNGISLFCARENFLLAHDMLIAAHSCHVTACIIRWICIVVNAHNRETLLNCNIVGKLHWHSFLMEGMQLLITCLSKSFTGCLSFDQVSSLHPAEEPIKFRSKIKISNNNQFYLHDWDQKYNGDKRHNNTRRSTIFVPWMSLAIIVILHYIVDKLKLEIWNKIGCYH